jgi:ribulose-5-phosphate 4-epimerase/fuculose-1-phosphate aldolase
MSSETQLREDLACAYRILAHHNVIDAYGHVSVRSEKNPNRYFLARHLAPQLVRPEDMIEYDLDSNPIDDGKGNAGREGVRERFIHGEAFKARPEVMSVVHNHSPTVVPFSVTGVPMKALFHMAAFVGDGLPVWDIADAQKGTDMLVKTPYLGQALARSLGGKPAVLMRGHGATVVGESLPRSVGRSVYLEMSARMQLEATLLAGPGGRIAFMHADEVAASVPAQDYNRAWPLWRAWALEQLKQK